MKRIGILCILTMVLLSLVGATLGCQPQPSSELEEFMAQAIIDDCWSPEAVYVAHVVSTSAPGESMSPLRIWKYEQGRLVDGDRDTLLLAITSSQPSDWPPHVFLFQFTSVKPDYAKADVRTLYDTGIMPGSRGGNAATWELEKQDDQWTVVSKEPYMVWD